MSRATYSTECHVILYSKSWYKKTNAIEDIKTIFKNCCEYNFNPREEDLWVFLIDLCFKISPKFGCDIMYSLFNGAGYYQGVPFGIFKGATPLTSENGIEKALSWLGQRSVQDIESAGIRILSEQANNAVLPLKREESN